MVVGSLARTRTPQAVRAEHITAALSHRAMRVGSRQSSAAPVGLVLICVVIGAAVVGAATARWAAAAIVLPSGENVVFGNRHAERPLVGATPGAPANGDCASLAGEFTALQKTIGATIGQPLECAHTDPSTGDTLQRTSTGLAIFRRDAQMPSFTDGFHRWALTAHGVITWEGDALDPPSQLP